MDLLTVILLLLFRCCLVAVIAMPEQGITSLVMITNPETKGPDHYAGLSKSMYAGSFLSLDIHCTSPGLTGTIQWVIRSSICANEFMNYDDENFVMLRFAFETADRLAGDPRFFRHNYVKSKLVEFSCNNNSTFKLPTYTDQQWLDAEVKHGDYELKSDRDDEATEKDYSSSQASSYGDDYGEPSDEVDEEVNYSKEEDTENKVPTMSSSAAANATSATLRQNKVISSNKIKQRRAATTAANNSKAGTISPTQKPLISHNDALVQVPVDSVYMFVMYANYDDREGQLEVTVETYGDYGYLSAIDWPLLPFYGIMFSLYTLSLIIWFVLCCCFRKDLLQIQYWIGAVIFLGFVEQAAILGDYYTVNDEGKPLPGLLIFGELVSTTKRALSRMLVIIVSVGLGIVKPFWDPILQLVTVVAAGICFFVLCCIEGFWRATTPKATQQTTGLMTLRIMLLVVELLIFVWIITSLVLTMRTLRIRSYVHKLSLYRHFRNAFILSILASVGFVIWSILQHKRVECLKDWKDLWIDEAYWHLQFFCIILMALMILFRPSANNQRYMYLPFADGDFGDAVEPLKKDSSGVEKDPKLNEDNIPAWVADSTFPSLVDSDKLMITKYEI